MKQLLPCLLAATVLLFGCSAPRATVSPDQDKPAPDRSAAEDDSPFKKYDEVITEEAISDEGVIDVHRVDDDYFFEVPESVLGKEMLLVSRIAKTPANLSGFPHNIGQYICFCPFPASTVSNV